MAHSFAQQASFTCQTCGQPISPDIWLIIDTAERPDLLARARDGALHRFACPNGHAAEVDAPLLIFRPGEARPLLFSPAQRTTAEQDRQMAAGLLGRLADSLGDAWRDEWLAGVSLIPREALPAVLAGADPEAAAAAALAAAMPPAVAAALEEIAAALAAEGVTLASPADLERALAARPALRAKLAAAMNEAAPATAAPASTPSPPAPPPPATPDDPLPAALQAFVQADSWFASYRFVRAHPELLSAAAEKQLAERIAAALGDGDRDAAAVFHEHLALLQRARAVGAAAAFAEKLETTAAELEAAAEAEDEAADIPPGVRQALDEIVAALEAEGVTPASPEDLERALAARPALAARLEAAERETRTTPEAAGATPDPLLAALQTFVQAETWFASYQYVSEHPELLGDAAAERLAGWVEQATAAGNEPMARHFAEHLALLQRARAVGAAAAFAEKLETTAAELEAAAERVAAGTDLQERYVAEVNRADAAAKRYLDTGDLTALDEASAAWDRILNDPNFTATSEHFQVAALNDSAVVSIRRYEVYGRLPDLDRALAQWAEAVARTPENSIEQADSLSNLGNGLRNRYMRTGQPEDLDAAITAFERAVARTPANSSNYGGFLSNLGTGLHVRYARTGRPEDLDAAVVAFEAAVANTPADSPNRAMCQNNLGTGLRDRYARMGRLQDLNEAINAFEEAEALTPAGSPNKMAILNNLGTGLYARYARIGQPADLDAAIVALEDAAARTLSDSPGRAATFNSLGNGLHARYEQTGRPEDLDAAIVAYEEAMARTPEAAPERAGHLSNLGIGLSERYARTGQLEDLDAAIAAYEDAVNRIPDDAPDRAGILNNLGNGLRARYAQTGRLEDLVEAITFLQDAVARTPTDAPEWAVRLSNLGVGLRDHYEQTGQSEDLDKAIAAFKDAVARTPADAPDRAGRLHNLGLGLSDRYDRMGQPEDLDAAITAYEDGIALTPAESPGRALQLNSLGLGLRARYAQTGLLEDLDAAIAVHEDAVARTPANAPDRAGRLNNLGLGLHTRYIRTGLLEDLNTAITTWEEAVALTSADWSDRASCLNSLGIGLRARYARTGRQADLDAAINAFEDVVARVPANSPDRAAMLNNLGLGLRDRYRRTKQPEDLDAVIAAFENAVARTPTNAPERAGFLNNLGLGLADRYAQTGQPEDLDMAIAAYEEVIDRVPADAPDRASYLNNLGIALRSRYALVGRLEDLDEAIAVLQDAVARASGDSPYKAGRLNNLGNGLRDRYARTGRPEDLDAALGHCRAAALAAVATAGEIALGSVRNWASLALARQVWAEALQAAAQGRATLRRLDEANVLAGERLSWRREVQGLAAAEAYAHARRGDSIAAVLALETGQAGQINAALGRGRDRALLERLRGDDPALFAAYETAAAEARAAQRAGGETWRDTPGARPDAAALRDRAAAAQTALDDVVARIAARPGYEALFAPIAFDDVAAAVGNAPLAYLATTPAGSVILLLHRAAAAPELLWAGLTSDELDRLLVRREQAAGNVGPVAGGLLPAQMGGFRLNDELAAALPALGERLMAPLAVRLRQLGATAVTLIPGGRLNLLPLHAATYQVDDTPRAFLDEFAVAFAPSGQAARGSGGAGEQGGGGERALVVGNPLPLPEGVASLRYAREEAEAVVGLLGGDAAFAGGVAALYETAATLPAVAAALPGRRVLHFAGHGTFDPAEPLDSGLVMAGGERLTLRAVRDGAALAGARLVVLSACQTGLTDFRELPDEVIGLPAGILVAGAAGVLGSLWPVDDRSTALLMTEFHRRVLAGAPPAEALRAAQRWLRDVTWGELDAYYSHFLPRLSAPSAEAAQVEVTRHDPRAAAYADPYHWAAFTFSGA